MINPQLSSANYQELQERKPSRRPRQRFEKPRSWIQLISQFPVHAGLILWGLTCIFPLIWTVLTSLKTTPELYLHPFSLPETFRWSNYVIAWNVAQMGQYFLNSGLVTILSTLLVLFVSSTTAFSFSRFNFPLKGVLWAYFLFGFLIPHSILLIPLAILTRQLGIYDNLAGLAIIYASVGIPWNTFFLRAFMETIPKELEEAAILDGAGMWGVYLYVIMPLSQPALATMATFHILSSWSEFILALVLTGSTASRTLPVGISLLPGLFSSNEPTVAAGMMITIIPIIIVFIFLQRFIISGLTAGALKS